MSVRQHIISVLVENEPGVLARIAMLFSARGYNIDSLAVAPTPNPSESRMTIVVRGDDRVLDQIEKQLNKLVDTITVEDYHGMETVERELVLVRVTADQQSRFEIMQIVDTFRAKIVDVSSKSLVVEITGTVGKIGALMKLLEPYGILEYAASGRIAMPRGSEAGALDDAADVTAA